MPLPEVAGFAQLKVQLVLQVHDHQSLEPLPVQWEELKLLATVAHSDMPSVVLAS